MSKLSSDHPTTGTPPVTQTQEAAAHDIPSGDPLLQRGGGRLIFSAPSGSGKSTIVQWLMREHPELRLAFSISCTTRAPRGTEQNGVEYIFLSPEAFKEKIKNGEFLEYEEVYENRFYGTLKSQVESQTAAGQNVVFDVDVKGGCNIKKFYGDRALSIFSTGTHSVGHCHLDGTAVSDLPLYLTGDVVTDDVCVKFRFLNLEDIDLNLLLEEILQFLLELINILTTFSDDDTRASGTNSNGDELQRTLDDNAGNAGLLQTLVQVSTDLTVLYEIVPEVLATEPI